MDQQQFMDSIAKWQGQVEQRAAAIAAEFGGNGAVHQSKSVAKRVAMMPKAARPVASATPIAPKAPKSADASGAATERVRAAIANGAAKTTLSLVATLGLGASTVANALTALVRSGAVRRVGVGKYEAVRK